jgi:hypothetical protein
MSIQSSSVITFIFSENIDKVEMRGWLFNKMWFFTGFLLSLPHFTDMREVNQDIEGDY